MNVQSLKFWNRQKTQKDSQPDSPKRAFGFSGGTHINSSTSMEVAAYYRGLVYVSTQIAKLPWHVKDKNNNIIENTVSGILRLSPNPEMNIFQFKLLAVVEAINEGNHYSEIERDIFGRAIGIHPINKGACVPVRDRNGKLWYRIDSTSSANGIEAYLPPEDVFAVRNFHTNDGIVGQGVIAYAMTALGIAKGADNFANALYANGGMPSGILTVPGGLDDEAFARFKDSWNDANSGRKTGGTAVLEEGTKYDPMSLAPDVLQFIESRKFSVLEMARFLGVPPQKLYDSASATYNNIEHANLEVVTDTLDSWACNLEKEADVKLLKNYKDGSYKTEMDIRSVFRGDMKTRAEYFGKRMSTASMTPNQIREMEGDAPYEGGDEYYIANNNFSPVSRQDEIIDSQISNANKKKETEDAENELANSAKTILERS